METPTAGQFQFATGTERKAALADVGAANDGAAAVDADTDVPSDTEDAADAAMEVAPDVVPDAVADADAALDTDAGHDTEPEVAADIDPTETDSAPVAETEVAVDPCAGTVCTDENPCTDSYCDPIKGCVYPANAATCTDGNACTVGDGCKGTACLPGAATGCDDGNGCTNDSCDKASGCANLANSAICADDGNACSLDVCAAGACTHPFAANNAPCDDKDPCTVPDGCVGGLCMGLAPKNCDDGSGCTNDICDKATGNCIALANAASCTDGDACTEGDNCDSKACAPGAKATCDDKNPCTDDSCDKGKGCVYLANAGTCSDGDACTGGDACTASLCKPGAAVKCDDGNLCTADGCDKGKGCTTVAAPGACSDSDACTTADACADGVCKAGPLAIWQTKLDLVGKKVVIATSGMTQAYPDAALAVAQVETAGQSHARAVRIGLDGKVAWAADLNDPAATWAYLEGIAPLGDGRTVLVGMSYPQGKTSVDGAGWVVVIDASGKKLSEALIATSGYNTRLGRAVKLSDGSLVLIGASAAPSKGDHHDAMLVGATVAADGKVTVGTPKYFTGAYASAFGGAVVEAGDNLALFGRYGGPAGVGYFARVDKSLNVIGKATFIADNEAADKDLVGGGAVAGGGYLAAGTKLTAPGIYSAWLVRLDGNGAVLWQKTYGGSGGKQVGAVATADNGDRLLTGYSYEGGDVTKNDRWLLRVDGNGNEVWQRTYVAAGDQRSYAVMALAGGPALMGGLDGNAASIWRVDGFGYGSCEESGGCAAKAVGECEDKDPCTLDTCDPKVGCTHTTLTTGTCAVGCAPAGSGNACANGVGKCENGHCMHTDAKGYKWTLVPAGKFWMGCNPVTDSECSKIANENPQHEVELSAYWIGVYEVTAAQYKGCVTAGASGCSLPAKTGGADYSTYGTVGKEQHPVNHVSWAQSQAVCQWLGGDLPTEAQWEKAARGGCEVYSGKDCKTSTVKYPWGNTEPVCGEQAVFTSGTVGCGKDATQEVGAGSKQGTSSYGAYDIAGNLLEWTKDWYDSGFYSMAAATAMNSVNNTSSSFRVARGGAFYNDAPDVRAGYRGTYSLSFAGNIGVRCAKPLTPPGMVHIPAGTFKMGCVPGDTKCTFAEKPQHDVTLSAYYMDIDEVTVKQYALCKAAGTCSAPKTGNYCNWEAFGQDDHPANCVTWQQADDYCKWRGARLPTEAEWERAARGGLDNKLYPWGDGSPTCTPGLPNTVSMAEGGMGCGMGTTQLAGVGKLPNGLGLRDMAGNVHEWVADWYSQSYYASSPKSDPTGPVTGDKRILRGGSASYNDAAFFRTSHRLDVDPPATAYYVVAGFRCAKTP